LGLIELRRRFIVRRELWFDEPCDAKGADLMVFYHWSKPADPAGAQAVHSLELDVSEDPAQIFAAFSGTTRNEINRAGKEGVTFQVWSRPPRETVEEFFAAYRPFTTGRGLDCDDADPVWMHDYAAQGGLRMSRAHAPGGEPLVWHTYVCAPGWIRLLHSVTTAAGAAPEQRKMTGWANRYLHWMDMQEARKSGIGRYDFGGWYSGAEDQKLLRINAFKEQFGAQKTCRYNWMLPVSAKGKLFLETRKRLKHDSSLVHFV
jgi:hypothetical protein